MELLNKMLGTLINRSVISIKICNTFCITNANTCCRIGAECRRDYREHEIFLGLPLTSSEYLCIRCNIHNTWLLRLILWLSYYKIKFF